MSPRTSLNGYERTLIPPPTATTIKTNGGYDEISEKHSRIPPKVRLFSINYQHHYYLLCKIGGISSSVNQSTSDTCYESHYHLQEIESQVRTS